MSSGTVYQTNILTNTRLTLYCATGTSCNQYGEVLMHASLFCRWRLKSLKLHLFGIREFVCTFHAVEAFVVQPGFADRNVCSLALI